MTTIPSSAIRLSYLWPCNLAHAAFTLSETHKVKITPQELELRWESECVNHPLLHELGTRPETGFKRTDELLLAVSMMEKEHNGEMVA